MQLLDELRAEHELIEAVLGALRTFVARRVELAAAARTASPGAATAAARGGAATGLAAPGAVADDGAAFGRFFRLFAGSFHHGREEEVLFPALVGEAGLPADRGPLASLVAQHREMERQLATVEALAAREQLTPEEADLLQQAALAYSHALWAHIDAENSVLLPESRTRLRRAGVAELPTRPPGVEEQTAAEEGRRLLARYPPAEDRTIVRAEGCIGCPSHGTTCDGVEREWWSDEEWDDFFDRVG